MTPTRRTRQRILKAISLDRTDSNMDLVVIEWRTWRAKVLYGRSYVGEVEIQYNTFGWRAVYGFDSLGNITLFMD